MAARNRARFEGTVKRSPSAWDLKDGRKRAIFTLRVERENGRYDYIDCCAYNDIAQDVARIEPGRQIEMVGWLMTFRQPRMEYKRTTLVVEEWRYVQ